MVDRGKCEFEHSIKMINFHLRANSLRQWLRVHSHYAYALYERARVRGCVSIAFNYSRIIKAFLLHFFTKEILLPTTTTSRSFMPFYAHSNSNNSISRRQTANIQMAASFCSLRPTHTHMWVYACLLRIGSCLTS